MLDRRWLPWLYPKSTGDPGSDRNSRTLQFSCYLLASAAVAVLMVSAIDREWQQMPLLVSAIAGLVAAVALSRAGRSDWAGRTAFLIVLLSAILLVFRAHDGFRSHSMLLFPGLLLISLMMLDRASYVATAAIVVVTVAALGVAVKHGLTRATPPVRTTYDSIFYVDLNMLVIAIIGSRIARDTQRNTFDLGVSIDRLSAANLELIQVREHLQDSEERLKSAQRLTHVGSWHWNLGTNQVVCSEECKQIFGQPEDYAPSLEELLQIIRPNDRARVASEIQRGIAEKSGCSTEFQIVQPNGEVRTVTFTSQVLLDDAGSPRHIFGACQDVTDERRMQEESLASQKLETVGTLANGIAHDFNNLLGGVLAQAEMGLSELAAGSRPEAALKAICCAAVSGSEIVRQLMIYTGQEREPRDLVDVARTVEEMADFLKLSISKLATLHTDFDKDLPPVRASGAQIRQIVMNLVMNASEAIGDREGVIRLTVRRFQAGQDQAGCIAGALAERDCVGLEVADTGRGMSPETQARVFDPFFTTKPLRHGLGLAVVSGIVRMLAGGIHLASEPGKGTIFRVLLPCEEGAANDSPRPNTATESTNASQAATALVVEDEDSLRGPAAKMLRKSGFTVLEAPDGTTALGIIRGDRAIEVLLLDVTLPGTPSQEVLAEAKRLRPAMRVIVTSAYGKEFAATSLQADVERFIRKPYSLRDLVELVRQTLS
uniref:histidine kinase n=1 Tax=Solibacter usitatus (strain Ellin6076) TaxID=234267 RepID=Q02A22_SOLUE